MQTSHSNAGIFVGGLLLITVGLITVGDQVFRALHWEFSWPFLLILSGALLFIGMFMGGKKAGWLAIPGSILGCIGLGMSFQRLTHHWEIMFYFWTLLIWFTGMGIYIMGRKSGSAKQKQSGSRVMKIGLFLFLVFATFFEMLFSRYTGVAFPVLFIVAGACVVLSRVPQFNSKRSVSTTLVSPAN